MKLTSPNVDPLEIPSSDWTAALDLASRHGWDRTTKQTNFGGTDERKDAFRYPYLQSIAPSDVKSLAAALRRADSGESSQTVASSAELATFLEKCREEVTLETGGKR